VSRPLAVRLRQAVKTCCHSRLEIKCQNCAAALSSATGGGVSIGYARVSTADQNMHLRQDALEKAGCECVFHDAASGAEDANLSE
jgi:Resolvase, N terminal domain